MPAAYVAPGVGNSSVLSRRAKTNPTTIPTADARPAGRRRSPRSLRHSQRTPADPLTRPRSGGTPPWPGRALTSQRRATTRLVARRLGMASGARAADRSVGSTTTAQHHLAAANSASSIPSASWLPLARQLATRASRPRCETTEATRRKQRRRQ